MALTTKNRNDIKSYFVKNAIPTEGNFADLVEAQLNQSDDGVFKLAGEPLSVVAASGEQRRVLRFYSSYPAANPDWLISLNPRDPSNPTKNQAGFGIADGAGNTRLFLNAAGNLGLGTNEPQGALDVRLPAGSPGWDRFVVNTTDVWGDSNKQHVTIGAGGAAGIMISNPHVPWFAPEARASIRYGRANGKSSETWWDVGVRPDGVFSFHPYENGAVEGHLFKITKTGDVTASGALRSNSLIHVTGNGGVLNLEGADHAYIQWYPMKASAGRKGWIGYGNTNIDILSVVSEAGLYLQGKTGIDLGNHISAPYGATIRDFGIGTDPHKNIYSYETLQMKDYNNLRVWFGTKERFIFGSRGDFTIQFDKGKWVLNENGIQGAGNLDIEGSAGLGYARETADFNAPLRSGFYQGNNPIGRVPWDPASPWVHLIAVRHSSPQDQYQLQIASSYAENDKLYFRKIARDLNDNNRPAWNEIATVTNGILKIGEWTLESAGDALNVKRGGLLIARFSSTGPRFLVIDTNAPSF